MKNNKNLFDLFKEATGLNPEMSDDIINVGYSYLIELPSALVHFMDTHTALVDKMLDNVQKHSDEYGELISYRAFSFNESKLLLSSTKLEHLSRFYLPQQLYLDDDIAIDTYRVLMNEGDRSPMELYQSMLRKFIESDCPELVKLLLQTKVPLNIPIDSFRRHCFMLGQTSSGKSTAIMNIAYELWKTSMRGAKRSIVVIDLHSDLVRKIAAFKMNRGAEGLRRVLYLDPDIRQTAFQLCGWDVLQDDYEFSINPFDSTGVSEKNIDALVEYLSEAIFSMVESNETVHMEGLIRACVEVLLRRPESDISDLKRFMNDLTNDDLVEFGKTLSNRERSALFENAFKSNGKLASTKSGIYSRLLTILGNTELVKLLSGKTTVKLEEGINSGKVILFNLGKSSLGKPSAQSFGKLIISLLSSYAFNRSKINSDARMDTYLIIDEFQNLVSESVEELLTESRKYKLFGFFASQTIGHNSSPLTQRIIEGNTALKFASVNDPSSLEVMSRNMKHLNVRNFDSLPNYSFWVNDKFNRNAGSYICRISDFLLDTSSQYFLTQKELEEFFLYQAKHSGSYRLAKPIEKQEENTNIYKNPFTE